MQQSPNQTDAMQPLPLAKTSSIAPLEHEPVHVDEDIIVVKSTNRVPKKFEQFQRVMLQVNDHAERVIQKNPEKAEIMIQAMLKAVEMFEQNDTIDAGQVFEQLAKRNDKNLSK